ncbi:MAG: hydroxymethylglutaryl-CoA lyase [Dehalococcoidia bacterium]
MNWPESVVITEVGPRDGLQNEANPIPLPDKIRLVDALSRTGLTRIEAASFVHPKAIPQMADAGELMQEIERREGVTYVALVPNQVGARNALAAHADEVAVVVSASESHNKANINRPVAETMEEIGTIAALCADAGVPWSGYISTAFGCPYEGKVAPEAVLALARKLLDAGAGGIALGDTTGIAEPRQVFALSERCAEVVGAERLRMHFHDTRGRALANVVAAMQAGIAQFDGSIGGLGGCPYAPGASGNVATEDMVSMLEAMGIATGVDMEALLGVVRLAEEIVGRTLDGRVKRTV